MRDSNLLEEAVLVTALFVLFILLLIGVCSVAQARMMAFSCKWKGYDVIFTQDVEGETINKTIEDDNDKIHFFIKDVTLPKVLAQITINDGSGVKYFTTAICNKAEE